MRYIVLLPLFLISTLFALDDSNQKQKNENSLFLQFDINKNDRISFKEIHDYKVESDTKRLKIEIRKIFKRCDQNKDGKISKEEAAFEIGKNEKQIDKECRLPAIVLDTMDLNQDGFLDKNEALENIRLSISQRSKITKQMRQKLKEREEKIRAKYIVKRFEICDKDKDEQLTLREATSRICGYDSDSFDELDKDHDELLSFDEMSVKRDPQKILQKKLKSKKFQQASPEKKLPMAMYLCDSDNDGILSKNEAFYADCNIKSSVFKKYDFNKDGFIDRDESGMVYEFESFQKYDKNKDGFLDKKEFLKSKYARYNQR